MNNTKGQEYRSALKKAVSSLNQVIELNYALEGIKYYEDEEYTSSEDFINRYFKPRMNLVEIDNNTYPSDYRISHCSFATVCNYVKCWQELQSCYEYTPDATNSFITQDGMIFYLANDGTTLREDYETSGSVILVDVNGLKKPNKPTTSSSRPRDQYTLLYNESRVIPFGMAAEIMYDKNINDKKTPAKNNNNDVPR